ncbi:MAG: MerR family transcriptional regulator [Lachnospiraceae bacterium]
MNQQYTTSEVAAIIGIHPNTVRLYENLQLITKPVRQPNGYRIFTDLHIRQFKIARLAFQVEILQNGLRKLAVNIVRATAACEFDQAIQLTRTYIKQLQSEKTNAEHAIRITEATLSGDTLVKSPICLTRKQTADYLQVTIDTLRNWELNGLLSVRRSQNGYRIYTEPEIRQLIIIKSLRCANYSLSAILRMLTTLSANPGANIRTAIETSQSDDIITACDRLLTSLAGAEQNARNIHRLLKNLKSKI